MCINKLKEELKVLVGKYNRAKTKQKKYEYSKAITQVEEAIARQTQ